MRRMVAFCLVWAAVTLFVASASAAPAPVDVQRFYELRGSAPAWSGTSAALADRAAALAAIHHAADEGLDPADYRVPENVDDAAFTAIVLRFARDLRRGRLEPTAADRGVGLPTDSFDAAAALSDAVVKHDVAGFLAGLPPPHTEYRRMKSALAAYRAIAAHGGWPSTITNPGSLWRRLTIEDPVLATQAQTPERLDAAIRQFQRRHGLADDGHAGPKTLTALNVPVTARIDQIVANMERWRWVPRSFGATYIEVNAADATLNVVDNGRVVIASRIITGKPSTPTPMFSANVEAVTVNPSWHIPPSIARNEIWPKERRRPGYMASQHIVVEGDSLRQLPGDDNALGRIKLEMPNRFNSYLHDTPSKALFARDDRHFSHGCMRVQEILPLASYALSGDVSAALDRLQTEVAGGQTVRIPLTRPLPVYVLYWTAIAHDDGAVDFRSDVYGRDARLLAALAGHRAVGRVANTETECELAAG